MVSKLKANRTTLLEAIRFEGEEYGGWQNQQHMLLSKLFAVLRTQHLCKHSSVKSPGDALAERLCPSQKPACLRLPTRPT